MEQLKACKELPPGEQIFNILEHRSPTEQLKALREAEERIHSMYSNQKENLMRQIKEVDERWGQFKGEVNISEAKDY